MSGEGWIAVTFSRSSKLYFYKTRNEDHYKIGDKLEIHNSHGYDQLTVKSVGVGPGGQRSSGGTFMKYKYIEDREIFSAS
jgi:hypothetical protein